MINKYIYLKWVMRKKVNRRVTRSLTQSYAEFNRRVAQSLTQRKICGLTINLEEPFAANISVNISEICLMSEIHFTAIRNKVDFWR